MCQKNIVDAAIEIFKATKVRRCKVDKEFPDDIHIISGEEGEEFGQIDILFSIDDNRKVTFRVRIDSEWFLCKDMKFRENYELAESFEKDKTRADGVVLKTYNSIELRAMEAVGYVLMDRFKKESEIK